MNSCTISKVPFLDLRVTDDAERQELLDAVDTVLRHGRIVLGPEVEQFEQRVASLCGRKYSVGINSGTDAIYLGLRSLGIGPGDEVITTALSWVATANAIALTGATPVFADILDDLTIDPASVARLVSSGTKAILPVHYTGKICRTEELLAITDQYAIPLIEDAAQAFGATRFGKPAGSFGTIACFSMNPMKVLAACGEAGAIVTDSADTVERLHALRYNGTVNREICLEPSLNGRLDTIQAAILLKRLDHITRVIGRRREIAAYYHKSLQGVVKCPHEESGCLDSWYTYTIQVEGRDELKAFLAERGIETKIQHPILMPHQSAYKRCRAETANAERLLTRILCIPCHEKLSDDDASCVTSSIRNFYGA